MAAHWHALNRSGSARSNRALQLPLTGKPSIMAADLAKAIVDRAREVGPGEARLTVEFEFDDQFDDCARDNLLLHVLLFSDGRMFACIDESAEVYAVDHETADAFVEMLLCAFMKETCFAGNFRRHVKHSGRVIWSDGGYIHSTKAILKTFLLKELPAFASLVRRSEAAGVTAAAVRGPA